MRIFVNESHLIHMNGEPAKRVADLAVWRLAHELTLGVYQISKTLPKWEMYALGDQMRRASVSVPANIAEGFRRRTLREKLRFLNIAQASLEETRYYFVLVRDLGYGETHELQRLADRVGTYLTRYAETVRAKAEAA
jgi:four helix bundle protein